LEGIKNEPKTNLSEPELLDAGRFLTGSVWKAWREAGSVSV